MQQVRPQWSEGSVGVVIVISADSSLSDLNLAAYRITARPNASNAGLVSAIPAKLFENRTSSNY